MPPCSSSPRARPRRGPRRRRGLGSHRRRGRDTRTSRGIASRIDRRRSRTPDPRLLLSSDPRRRRDAATPRRRRHDAAATTTPRPPRSRASEEATCDNQADYYKKGWGPEDTPVKDCEWVSGKPLTRCLIKDENKLGASYGCGGACGRYLTCPDSDSVDWHKEGEPAKNCAWRGARVVAAPARKRVAAQPRLRLRNGSRRRRSDAANSRESGGPHGTQGIAVGAALHRHRRGRDHRAGKLHRRVRLHGRRGERRRARRAAVRGQAGPGERLLS